MTPLKETRKRQESRESRGMTPLHCACFNQSTVVAKLLLGFGANVCHINGSGNNALHEAAAYGYTDILKILIDHIYATYDNIAAPSSNEVLMQLLERHNNKGATPLTAAIIDSSCDAVKYLLTSGNGNICIYIILHIL